MKNRFLYIVIFLFGTHAMGGELRAQAVPDTAAAIAGDTVPKPVVDTSVKAPSPVNSNSAHSGASSPISMIFVKEKVEHGPDSVFFNILKITNNNGKPVKGVVTISVPTGWKVISEKEINVDILPGETEFVPMRISLGRNVIGGVSYLVNATLLSDRSLYPDKNQNSISKVSYVLIPEKTRWDVVPVSRMVYFDRFTEYAPMYLKLSNKGNGHQVVKLEFDIGSSLELYGAIGKKYFTSVELKPNRDTILTFNVKYLPPNESSVWNRDFKKLSIRIAATSDTIIKRSSVSFKYLESYYKNVLAARVYPLNFDLQLQNLLSPVIPRLTGGAYGTIFFKNEHNLNYLLRFASIPFGGYSDPYFVENYLWRNIRFYAHYNAGRWTASAGDVSFLGESMIGVGGRGISGSYRINEKHEVGGLLAGIVGSPVYNAGLFYRTTIGGIGLNSTVTYILNDYNKMNNLAASVQAVAPLWPGHRIEFMLSASQSQHLYNNNTFVDPSGNPLVTTDPGAVFNGLGARLSYHMNRKKLRANINATVASKHFSPYYNGRFDLHGNGHYYFNRKYFLMGYSNYRLYEPLIYTQGILRPFYRLSSGGHRIDFANKVSSRLSLFAGPSLDHTYNEQQKVTTLGDTTFTRFSSVTPKLNFRLGFRNRFNGSITPSVGVGRTYITRAEDSTLATNTIISNRSYFIATAGLSFIQGYWGLNVFYYYGPHSIVTQTDYYYFNAYSTSLRVIPYFQKYFFNRSMLLRSYNNYQYDAVGNTERITLNATLSFFLENNWTFYVDNNIYMQSRINSEGNKFYSRAFYLNLGVRKSFDIPQPGVKYYDLRVVCFKDLNGNGTMDGNEQGLSQIVITLDRTPKLDSITRKPMKQLGQFAPAEMVTDNFGQIIYSQIPEGEFKMDVISLINLKDLFNIKGQKQTINISSDTTYYVPFVQTYRVNGHVIVNRDEYTSVGSISKGNIRITASDSLGNSYPALTSSDGGFTLYVPKAGTYFVTINNVFGEQFVLQQSTYEVIFDGIKEYYLDFIFNEKKRQINISGAPPASRADSLLVGNKFIVAGRDTLRNAKVITDSAAAAINGPGRSQDASIPVGPGISYRIQLTASSRQIPPSQYAARFKGISNILEYVENGTYKYTTSEVKTLEEAQTLKAQLRSRGFSDAFMVPFYKGNRVNY